ncbi:MAG: arginase [Citrobacter freundii]|nr:MAG: arginase [Citrobacter freundii]
MHSTTILEFPSNLGLKEPSPGHEPGVRKLPPWLAQHGFHTRLNPASVIRLEPPPYSTKLDNESGVRNATEIINYAKQQASLLEKVMRSGSFPLVIGGDCSILIGNALALKKTGKYALFFLDGHHDFMLPALSQTGGAAGMDTAIVTGHGHEKLTNIDGFKPYFKEENVWCVGNREYYPPYVESILQSSIHYIDLGELRRQGTKQCAESFLNMVEEKQLDGFWIHIDADVLDDELMPAVDSRTPGGITYEELDDLLQPLLRSVKAGGLGITIIDPELDPDGKYTTQFVERFCKTFNASR